VTTARDSAAEVLAWAADPFVLERADELVADGTAEWTFDPYVDGVVGLVKPGTRRAFIVVYLDDEDFELGEDFVLSGRESSNDFRPSDV
jgi:hypothetical protein